MNERKTVFFNLHSSFIARYETAIGDDFNADKQFGNMSGNFQKETPKGHVRDQKKLSQPFRSRQVYL